MGFFYFDESIHERGGFILGAFVYSSTDLTDAVKDALSSVGLVPGIDEFKSGDRAVDSERRFEMRHLLRMEMQGTRIGVILTGSFERGRLGNEAIAGLSKFMSLNDLGGDHEVFFDQGVGFERRAEALSAFAANTNCQCHLEQDSKVIAGLQIADLAAHSLATMVLETMGLVSKRVKTPKYLGYEDDSEVELGFELWATTRGCLFMKHRWNEDLFDRDPVKAMTADTATYALHISEGCPARVRDAALSRLGTMYLGCTH